MTKQPNDKLTRSIRQYLQRIGAKGGEARGKTKRRGGPEHYRALALKRWGKPSPEETR